MFISRNMKHRWLSFEYKTRWKKPEDCNTFLWFYKHFVILCNFSCGKSLPLNITVYSHNISQICNSCICIAGKDCEEITEAALTLTFMVNYLCLQTNSSETSGKRNQVKLHIRTLLFSLLTVHLTNDRLLFPAV